MMKKKMMIMWLNPTAMFAVWWLGFVLWFGITGICAIKPPSSLYYHYMVDAANPYTVAETQHNLEHKAANHTTVVGTGNDETDNGQIRSRRNKQWLRNGTMTPMAKWEPVRLRRPHHSFGVPVVANETVTVSGSQVRPVIISIRPPSLEQPTFRRQRLTEQEQTQQETETQSHPLPHYQCDSIIHDQQFVIESPDYPATYPANRICTYYIGRNRSDVCQIEVTISDMDIEDTAQCTADYLDFGQHPQPQPEPQRLCGMVLRNTRRLVPYPANGSYIRITFHSDGKNDRPHRGFSAEVQQVPNSCGFENRTFYHDPTPVGYYPADGQIPVMNYPPPIPAYYPPSGPMPQYPPPVPTPPPPAMNYPGVYYQSPLPADQYGQRIRPPTRMPSYIPPGGVTQPGYGFQPGFPGYPGTKGTTNPTGSSVSPYDTRRMGNSNNTGPIYLASYCDVYIGEMNGEIRSPGYPFGYPVNHSCIYTIKKASDDVCQLELIFHHFDVQTPNAQKDLTDNCHGDYLEMPDRGRLCGYYTQSMSGDYKLKKYYAFPGSSDHVFLQFHSDANQTPDGSGFWIDVRQLPNSCTQSTVADNNNNRPNAQQCDKVISGRYAQVDRVYSPNYPQFYGPRLQCAYFVQPADDRTCEFELELVQFSLEPPAADNTCRKDYFQLPDRRRICGRQKFRRVFQFPKYHDRTAMFMFHSDDQIEDQGFEIIVRQIPNSCPATMNLPGSPAPGGYNTTTTTTNPWNTNVYVPQTGMDPNDPNMAAAMAGGHHNRPMLPPPPAFYPSSPTPVFTYDNNTGGLQPYRPPISGTRYPYPPAPPIPGVKVSGQQPTNWWSPPSSLNDPRNVDSSGTIPLYYGNGTLATRIPPMKPVDMIPYLKKGKTFNQKGGNPGLQTVIQTPKDLRLIAANRYPSDDADDPAEAYQSSAKIRAFSDPIPIAAESLPPPAYQCDQTITRSVEYIRSPNFPHNYPPVTRCIYQIFKSDPSVCQIRLHILSLDLEYTPGCRNDYLRVEPTGEKLCGHISQPEVRTINYFGYARDIRLIFNSDRKVTGSGFEVRIEQVSNSCEDLARATTKGSLDSVIGTTPARTTTAMSSTPFERIVVSSSEPGVSPQALTISNHSTAAMMMTTVPVPGMLSSDNPSRICGTTAVKESYFESDNFPLAYPGGINCQFNIFRANADVCRLELEFIEFNVGDEINFAPSPHEVDQTNRPVGQCQNDFLEIDGIRYCGRRSGQKVAVNFPRQVGEVSLRFLSAGGDGRFNGFRIRVKQIDQNCRSNRIRADDRDSEFDPAIIESCPKQINASAGGGSVDPGAVIAEPLVKLQSPGFGQSSTLQYNPFLDCHHVIQRAGRNVCALQIRFETFELEESPGCAKDYLEISNGLIRLCGTLPNDTIRVFDFFDEQLHFHFHTDADIQTRGFAMILKQIRC